MSNSSKRDADISRLHPAIRTKVQAIRDQLNQENIPFEIFEAFRSPERQAELFAQGRTTPGTKVTWAGPWRSYHQYGLAVDMVLKINGNWSWNTTGAEAAFWPRMHDLAKAQGLTPLFNRAGKLIELPHIQLAGLTIDALSRGNYPAGADAAWSEHLGELISGWSGGVQAPPKPALVFDRPPVDTTDAAELEDVGATRAGSAAGQGDSAGLTTAQSDARFQQLHAFVRRWEGGFSNHPADNGGATNMGITRATLAAWRGAAVTVEDVRNLTRTEADAILRANYYAVCRCGEMPDRTAMVVYNGAVLHGPSRSIEFLQTAFNNLGMTSGGKPLKVDGIIGSNTTEAARRTDASVLAGAYMDVQDAYFRRHEDFATFGTGWLNRLAALREFIATLPQGAGLRPMTTMTIADSQPDNDMANILSSALTGLGGGDTKRAVLGAILGALMKDDGTNAETARRRDALLTLMLGAAPVNTALTPPILTPGGLVVEPALTPVNAALGNGIGKLLDGKKSVIGVVGLILTVLLPEIGLTGSLINVVRENQSELITLLATFTGWGFLGKIDKAIRSTRPAI